MKHPAEPPLLTPDDLRRLLDLSQDQIDRLAAYLALLTRWQQRINLVGPVTLADPWRRHVLDSAQLVPLLPQALSRIVDLGSGAGFPGLVLAILTPHRIELVESDARKCAFLAEAARMTATDIRIRNLRAESLRPSDADVVVARALAPLPKLLGYARNWLAPHGICLQLKGRGWQAELTEAQKTWKMRTAAIPSRSDPSGMVLQIEDLSPRDVS